MTEVGARDRWIMAGLVILGLFTVVAGVLSGRSTINYVLGRDAREAALAWSGKIDAQLRNPQSDPANSATPDIQALNAAALDEVAAGAQEAITLPTRPSFREDGFALIDGSISSPADGSSAISTGRVASRQSNGRLCRIDARGQGVGGRRRPLARRPIGHYRPKWRRNGARQRGP